MATEYCFQINYKILIQLCYKCNKNEFVECSVNVSELHKFVS